MIILIIGAVGVLVVIGLVVLMRSEDRRDDRALRRRNPFPEPDHPGFADITMPPEIAHEPPAPSMHELPALGDAVWHPRPSPAAQLASPRAPGPGTAAAAEAPPSATPPAPAPPPLPDPAYAAATGLPHNFADWLSDTFVGRVEAIRKGGA